MQYQSVLLTGILSIAITVSEVSVARQNIQQPSTDVKTVSSYVVYPQSEMPSVSQTSQNIRVFPQSTSFNVASVSGEKLQKQASQVIRHYYNAINHRDYKSAYADWYGNGAASQKSFEQFQQGFKDTKSVQLNIGEIGSLDGAAGSSYIEIPVNITATSVNGTTKHFRGSYILRRVNDIPGSTLSQRMWHIYSAKITQVN